jgi:hypothetical protein
LYDLVLEKSPGTDASDARKWIKEEFGSPAGFFSALDANKKGKARAASRWWMRTRRSFFFWWSSYNL